MDSHYIVQKSRAEFWLEHQKFVLTGHRPLRLTPPLISGIKGDARKKRIAACFN